MEHLVDLSDKKILITGASSGIGRETAILATRLGATIVLCGRDEQRLKETRQFMEDSKKHITIVYDLCDFEHYNDLFDQAVADGIHLKGLVHCAGIASVLPLRAMKHKQVQNVMDTNFGSFMELMSFYGKRKYSDGGSVVAVSAINAHYPQKCMSAYAASKAAIEAAASSFALELSVQGIRVNCVVPGSIDTPMAHGFTDNVGEDKLDLINKSQLLGMGRPIDVANMIAYLLSDASSFITGRQMFVDGGRLGQI